MSKATFEIDEKKLEVTMSRVFEASRERVWRAHVDPEQVVKWWGPKDYKMIVEKLDTRNGGTWRILHINTDGQEFWFSGVYHDVVKPEKIERTFIYEAFPDNVMTEITYFEAMTDAKTRLTTVSHFPSLEALKGMTGAGMEWGARESSDRLADLVQH